MRRESMISDENQWYPTKINDIRRESMMSDENQWYCTKINDIKRKQRYNYYMVIHIILLIMCKAIILISICIQVYDLCTDSIYPCYDDRWFSMIIDDGTPWWKYGFGVKQGLSRGSSSTRSSTRSITRSTTRSKKKSLKQVLTWLVRKLLSERFQW